MSFKEIQAEIKPSYNSANSDIVNDFYNKVLSESFRYDRISGFFSSTSLAAASKGFANFIKNDGHMRLLCGAELTQADQDSINNSENLKDYISKKFLEENDNLENELVKNHMKMLGWMISNNFLEIKIVVPVDKEKGKLNADLMFHSKIGLLYDENEDCIVFRGSVNETLADWTINIENFSVEKSWIDDRRIIADKERFEEIWNGKSKFLKVFDVPEAIKNNLIEIAPESKEELDNLLK